MFVTKLSHELSGAALGGIVGTVFYSPGSSHGQLRSGLLTKLINTNPATLTLRNSWWFEVHFHSELGKSIPAVNAKGLQHCAVCKAFCVGRRCLSVLPPVSQLPILIP